jgi:hypothetical protein
MPPVSNPIFPLSSGEEGVPMGLSSGDETSPQSFSEEKGEDRSLLIDRF